MYPGSLFFNCSTLLDHRQLLIFAKGLLHHAHDLAQCGIRVDTFHDVRHGVLCAQAGDAESIQRLTHPPIVACLADFVQAGYLSLISIRVHFQNWNGERLIFGVGIHAHDLADRLYLSRVDSDMPHLRSRPGRILFRWQGSRRPILQFCGSNHTPAFPFGLSALRRRNCRPTGQRYSSRLILRR